MYLRQRNDTLKFNDFKYFIVDTDCGGDDAQALIVADYYARSQNKILLGITCCNGNAVISDVVKNVLLVQETCGSSYPVYAGNDYSFSGENLKDDFFGKDGLGNQQEEFMKTKKINQGLLQKEKAYKFIADSAIKHKGNIGLVCIGPLTNLALAYHYNNDITDCFIKISLMGTSDTLAGMNTHFASEFNMALDPDAAYCVFSRFNNLIVSSLDTTCLNVRQSSTEQLFKCSKTKRSDLIRKIYQLQFSQNIPPLLVDPLAVIALFNQKIIKSGVYLRMDIYRSGHRTRGCSFIDYFSSKSQQKNIYLIKEFEEKHLVEEMWKTYADE